MSHKEKKKKKKQKALTWTEQFHEYDESQGGIDQMYA